MTNTIQIAQPKPHDQEYLKKYYLPWLAQFKLGKTFCGFLDTLANPDMTVDDAANTLQQNPFYAQYLKEELLRAAAKTENMDNPSLAMTIGFLGVGRTRQLLTGIHLYRVTTKSFPARKKTGEFDLKIDEITKYSTRLAEFLHRPHYPDADITAPAALIYDALYYWLKTSEPQQANAKELLQALDESFKLGFKIGITAVELSKLLPNFSYKRSVFAAGLLWPIQDWACGLLTQTPTTNNYLTLLEEIDERKYPEILRKRIIESYLKINDSKQFGTIALKAFYQHYQFYQPILTVISAVFQNYPNLKSKTLDPDAEFKTLLELAVQIGKNFFIPKDLKDPVFERWFTSNNRYYKINGQILIKLMHKISRYQI